nr:hypothetical protein [uncultured Capnocytophaga sp.]
MKNILLPFIFLTFVFSLQAQQTDWERYDLKGKVKQVKATTTFYSGECAARIDYVQWTCITEFDTQGNVVKNIWYAWKEFSQEHLYSYKGEKVTLRVHFYKQDKITKTKTYHYKKGEEERIEKEIEHTERNCKVPYTEQIRTFTGFYKNGILRSRPATTYEYDDHGNWIHKQAGTYPDCVLQNTRSIVYY